MIASALALPASAHTDGTLLAPYGDYMIRWYQPHRVVPIDSWDLEVTPHRNIASRFVATAQVVPDDSCWAVQVPINEAATVRVRSRSATGQVSVWSRPTTVPEPGLAAGALVGSGLLAALAGRRGRSARRQRARAKRD